MISSSSSSLSQAPSSRSGKFGPWLLSSSAFLSEQ
jgi:hypothetical protein